MNSLINLEATTRLMGQNELMRTMGFTDLSNTDSLYVAPLQEPLGVADGSFTMPDGGQPGDPLPPSSVALRGEISDFAPAHNLNIHRTEAGLFLAGRYKKNMGFQICWVLPLEAEFAGKAISEGVSIVTRADFESNDAYRLTLAGVSAAPKLHA